MHRPRRPVLYGRVSTDDVPDRSVSPGDPEWARSVGDLGAAAVSPRLQNLRRLADVTRRMVHGMALTEMDDDELAAAVDALELAAAPFSPDSRSAYVGYGESSIAGDPRAFFDHSPMLGESNPIAPPIRLKLLEDETTMQGIATFGAAYEGPPGSVHGGFVAAAFDEVLGAAQSLSGHPGMTGRLSVTYRSPTPLHTELVFRGYFDKRDGRKIYTSGTLHAGDVLCAEAEALFISIDSTRFEALAAEREAQFEGWRSR